MVLCRPEDDSAVHGQQNQEFIRWVSDASSCRAILMTESQWTHTSGSSADDIPFVSATQVTASGSRTTHRRARRRSCWQSLGT